MEFMGFSEWVRLREQAPAGQPQAPVAPGRKDDLSKMDSKIKQVMAANLTDPKKRNNALQNLAKQMAMDPNSKPEDLKKVASAMKSDDHAQMPARP